LSHLRPVPTGETLVTREELAKIMHVGVGTIDEFRRAGMPEIRWGLRLVRFEPSACLAWWKRESERRAA
jgi:hypothetical protein